MNKPFGEIIESSLSTFKAQCWQWDSMPAFGSLVITTPDEHGIRVVGIVHDVQTGSIDKSRQPYAYQKSEEQLRREQPQIFALLHTLVQCQIIGYLIEKPIYQIPAYPPKIHAFVTLATHEELESFMKEAHFMHLLCQSLTLTIPLEELLLALIRNALAYSCISEAQLNDFVATYAALTKQDYRRFKLFLSRVEALR